MTPEEANGMCVLAIGRLLRLAARPSEPGDVEEYYKLRDVVMTCAPLALDRNVGRGLTPDYTPNWARDRLKGAAGD